MPSGVNSRGNRYNTPAPSQPNTDSYHYSNQDGSYYYKNGNGSTYFDDGQGNEKYTPPPPVSYTRDNNATKASIDESYVFARGGFKNVYEGKYTRGKRAGQRCVSKEFKTGSVFEESYFKHELKVVAKALELINSFNDSGIINKKIWLNNPTIWTYECDGSKCLIEPMIANFEKFNSNTGWTPSEVSPWINIMQALSHYSYHMTHGNMLLCDLQGGIYRNGFIVTDPVIMCRYKNYGPTDLGLEGISTFFSQHECNEYCNSTWRTPSDTRVYFPVKEGSSMILPTRVSRAPLTCGFATIQEDGEDELESSDDDYY